MLHRLPACRKISFLQRKIYNVIPRAYYKIDACFLEGGYYFELHHAQNFKQLSVIRKFVTTEVTQTIRNANETNMKITTLHRRVLCLLVTKPRLKRHKRNKSFLCLSFPCCEIKWLAATKRKGYSPKLIRRRRTLFSVQ